MKKQVLPKYKQLGDALKKVALTVHPSRFHGLVCGVLCTSLPEEGLDRLDEWNTHVSCAKEWQVLHDLYTETYNKLKEFSFDFQLLLPNDRYTLANRACALTVWCQGFLEGLQLNQPTHCTTTDQTKTPHHRAWSDDVIQSDELMEALNNVTEIANMEYAGVKSSEENEAAYVEVAEYVRMAIVFIYYGMQANHMGKNHNFHVSTQ